MATTVGDTDLLINSHPTNLSDQDVGDSQSTVSIENIEEINQRTTNNELTDETDDAINTKRETNSTPSSSGFINPILENDDDNDEDTLEDGYVGSSSESDMDLQDTGCCAKRPCYRCSVLDFASITSHCLIFVTSLTAAIYCLVSKIHCQDQCLLDASYKSDGSVSYPATKQRCEFVLYSCLVSAGLPVLFICVSWVAQFSENKNWLLIQNLINFLAVTGISYVTYLNYNMYHDWCHGLQINMGEDNPDSNGMRLSYESQSNSTMVPTCQEAYEAWDTENETKKLQKLSDLTTNTMYILFGCVFVWATGMVLDFSKYCLVSRRLQRSIDADQARLMASSSEDESENEDRKMAARTKRRRKKRSKYNDPGNTDLGNIDPGNTEHIDSD